MAKKTQKKNRTTLIALIAIGLCLAAVVIFVYCAQMMRLPAQGQANLKIGASKLASEQFQSYLNFNDMVLHSENAELANCWFGLAKCRQSETKYQEAAQDYQHALKIRKRVLGPDSEETFVAEISWQANRCLADPSLDGEKEIGDLLVTAKKKFGEESYPVALGSDALGAWYFIHEKTDLALQYMSLAADLDDTFMISHQPLLSRLALTMMIMKQAQSRYQRSAYNEAAAQVEKVISRLQKIYGNETAYLVLAFELDGLALAGQGEKERAWAQMDQANMLGTKLVKEGKISQDLVNAIKKQNNKNFGKLGI